MRRIPALVALICFVGSSTAEAQTVNWAWSAGKQTNDGSITLKSTKSPGTVFNATKNPTATSVDTKQNAATQPPVLLMQSPPSSTGPNRWSLYYAERAVGLP